MPNGEPAGIRFFYNGKWYNWEYNTKNEPITCTRPQTLCDYGVSADGKDSITRDKVVAVSTLMGESFITFTDGVTCPIQAIHWPDGMHDAPWTSPWDNDPRGKINMGAFGSGIGDPYRRKP